VASCACDSYATAEFSAKSGTRHAGIVEKHGANRFRVAFPYKAYVPMTLICPKCQAATELRGTMDIYYWTWCRECSRLWRIELWTLVHTEESDRKMPWATSR
jgi:hypothetical protein